MALALVMMTFVMPGCKNWSNQEKGTAAGAAVGGAVGAIIGKKSGNTILGAIIGGAVGGTAGALIGRYMDKQAEELQNDLKGAKIERIGEGIKITFDSGILFDVNSAELKTASRENIASLANILNKYEDTNIIIEGHTDNTGRVQYNQELSERRANAVKNYAATQNVMINRVTTVGYGIDQPIADNTTVEGRAQNRRVEIAIIANEKLKRAAEKGEIQ